MAKERIHTDIVFVRHGETAGNNKVLLQGWGESHLSDNGVLQAKAAAEELKNEPFTAAYSSDLIRAVETATLLLEPHPGVELHKTPGLREWNVGDLDGQNQLELWDSMPAIMDSFRYERGDFDVPGGESRPQFQRRISQCLDDIVRKNCGGCVLIVSHGWSAHRILAHFYGPPAPGMVFPVPFNTGISRFRYFNEERACQLLCWNNASHLKHLAIRRNPFE